MPERSTGFNRGPATNDPEPDRPRSIWGQSKPHGNFRLKEGQLYARETRFVNALLELLGGGEPLNDATLTAAGREAFRFGGVSNDAANAKALRQAREMMANPNVTEVFTDLFAQAGFTKSDAAAAHVAHIKEGNYLALRDYWKMVMPQQPRQIEMKSAVLNMNVDDFEKSRRPAMMAARQLGEAHEQSDNKEALVVEFVDTERAFVSDERALIEESAEQA